MAYTVVSTVEFLRYFVTPNPQAQGFVFPFQPKQQLCYVIELGRTPKKNTWVVSVDINEVSYGRVIV